MLHSIHQQVKMVETEKRQTLTTHHHLHAPCWGQTISTPLYRNSLFSLYLCFLKLETKPPYVAQSDLKCTIILSCLCCAGVKGWYHHTKLLLDSWYIHLNQYCCSTSDAQHNSPRVLLKMYIITSSKPPTAPCASQSLQQSPFDSHRVQPDLILMPFSPTILHLHSVTDTPSCSLPAPASKTLQRGAEKWFNESEHWLYIH